MELNNHKLYSTELYEGTAIIHLSSACGTGALCAMFFTVNEPMKIAIYDKRYEYKQGHIVEDNFHGKITGIIYKTYSETIGCTNEWLVNFEDGYTKDISGYEVIMDNKPHFNKNDISLDV